MTDKILLSHVNEFYVQAMIIKYVSVFFFSNYIKVHTANLFNDKI